MNKSEQLIACLEGEIAKRDARIVELESDLAGTQSRVLSLQDQWRKLDAELAALKAQYQRDVWGLNNEGDPIGGEPAGGYANDNARLRAELASIKAQEPVAWAGVIEDCASLFVTEPKLWKAIPLYAAPVSEAKAQGVVQWPEADEIMQMAFEEGHPADDASGYYFELEEFDLFIDRLMSEVARLNAVPVQQVSVPACVTCCDVGIVGHSMLCPECNLPPAAPAADGWISVSERLPGEDDQVLCWCEDETVAWAEVSSHHNSFFTDMTHELLPVTHWMPLPAAPSANSAKGVV